MQLFSPEDLSPIDCAFLNALNVFKARAQETVRRLSQEPQPLVDGSLGQSFLEGTAKAKLQPHGP